MLDAGAPLGASTNLLISHEQSERVIDDPRIKGVALTGSVAAGRKIAARAGQNLKKSSMELGGSDALIVLDDAELEQRSGVGFTTLARPAAPRSASSCSIRSPTTFWLSSRPRWER